MENDPRIHAEIEQLVAEGRGLWQRESAENASDADRPPAAAQGLARPVLDLLRQRRGQREAGRDPDAADVRRADVVESYEQ